MKRDPLDALFRLMERTGVALPSEVSGCTPTQIERLEAKYGFKLPATYRRFLSVMGRKTGRLVAHDWLEVEYTSVLRLTAFARKALKEWGKQFPEWADFSLPDDALVILYRDQSDDYHFIRCNRRDDSAVWHYNLDAEPRARQIFRSVAGWVRALNKEAAEVMEYEQRQT